MMMQQQATQGQERAARQPNTLTLYSQLARLLAQGYHRALSSQSSPSSTLTSSPPPPLPLTGWRSQLQDALRRALVLPRPTNRADEEGGDKDGEDEEMMEWFWNALAPPPHRHHHQHQHQQHQHKHQHHTRGGGGGRRSIRDDDDALSLWSCPAAVASGLCEEVCHALAGLQQSRQTHKVAGRVLGLLLRHVAAGGGEAAEGGHENAGGKR